MISLQLHLENKENARKGAAKMIKLQSFQLKASELASCIYDAQPHQVSPIGLRIDLKIKNELELFLSRFINSCNVSEDGVYLRTDAFFCPETGLIEIIEVNAHFVDGWGIALNLQRAAGIKNLLNGTSFPPFWTTSQSIYQPELELACQELTLLGHPAKPINWQSALANSTDQIYWYGRFDRYIKHPQVVPANGPLIDDKKQLAIFSDQWQGDRVTVPECFWPEKTSWSGLHEDIIFKFRHKNGPEVKKARFSVQFKANAGRAKFIKKCFQQDLGIAQKVIKPFLMPDGSPTQLIILSVGSKILTAYMQIALPETKIINDNSAHGPVVFSN